METRKDFASVRKHARAGLTLVELMVVVAIMGILLSLATAAYESHQRRARRLDAQEGLQALQQAQARYRDLHPSYANTLQALGSNELSPAQHYQLSISQADEQGYTLTATPVGTQAKDEDCNPMRLQLSDQATFTLSAGVQTDDAHGCWKR